MKSKQVLRTCLACGTEFLARTSPSRQGRGLFCGRVCGNRTLSTKHGHAARSKTSPTYNTWVNMVSRCHRPYAAKFSQYGAKGITVCNEWRGSFDAFLRDMGERPDGCTIDRIDGTKGYFKENCRWANPKEQQRNLKNNRIITFNGESGCVSWWAEKLQISRSTLSYRIKRWGIEAAVTSATSPQPDGV